MIESEDLDNESSEKYDENNFQAQKKESDFSLKEVASLEKSASNGDEIEKSNKVLLEAEEKVLQHQEEIVEELIIDEKSMTIQADVYPCRSCEIFNPILDTEVTYCCGLCTRSLLPKDGIKNIWIVSTPTADNPQEEFDKLKNLTQDKQLSINYKFHIPKLKASNFDTLVSLLDELLSVDSNTENLLRRLANCTISLVGDNLQLQEFFVANNLDLLTYLTRFTWNTDKYPLENTLKDIFDTLKETIERISADLNSRSDEINNTMYALEEIKRDRMGNLLTRPLANLVKKEDLLLNSEYLTTLLVVVPISEIKKWWETYEKLIDLVVPQSSVELFSDENHSLVTVIVAKKCANDFAAAAEESKFVVRPFQFSERKRSEDDEIIAKLKKMKDSVTSVSLRWLKVKFSECFVSWIHIKALRVFTESVVRYGIPINFQAILLIPLKSKKLKKVLDISYKNLDCHPKTLSIHDLPQELLSEGINTYLPYVFLTISIIFHEQKTEK